MSEKPMQKRSKQVLLLSFVSILRVHTKYNASRNNNLQDFQILDVDSQV